MNRIFKKEKIGNKRRITILGIIKINYKKENSNLPKIELPKGHKLYEHMKSCKYYDKNLSRLIPIVKQKYKDLSIIDIGANIGDNLAILRHDGISCPTLCIEGDDEYFTYLEKNTKQYNDVEIKKIFLGSKDGMSSMDVVRDSYGSSHLNVSENQVNILTLDTVLFEHEKFKSAKFLKIDTDGFDNIVLEGAQNYLTTAKPIIFMEYCPDALEKQNDDGLSVFNYLAKFGYKKGFMYQNSGEYMFSFNIDNADFIEDMRDFYINSKRYCDLCLFSEEDIDLYKKCREAELKFFKNESALELT